MELLTESENRAFSSFLDSFASSSASPPRSNSPFGFLPPPPAPLFRQQSSHAQQHQSQYGVSDHGHSGTGQAGWNSSEQATRGGAADESGSFRPPTTTTTASWTTRAPSDYYNATPQPSTSTFFAPPPPAPLLAHRRSIPYQPPLPDQEAARLRKLQHAEELQKWMSLSRPSNEHSHEATSPKRSRGSEDRYRDSIGNGGGGHGNEDPIAAMLEAERKAGYAFGKSMNAAITRETSQARAAAGCQPSPLALSRPDRVEEVFAVPPTPLVASRSTRRRPSSSASSATADTLESSSLPRLPIDPDYEPSPPSTVKPRAKRKAPSSTASSSRSNSISSKPPPSGKEQELVPRSSLPSRLSDSPRPPPAASSSSSSTSVAATRTIMLVDDDQEQDPESADSTLATISPTPFKTPSNIPRPLATDLQRLPPRSRPRPRRSSISPSVTPATGGSGGGSGASLKPALLTSEQKKANHIASEQKRRAAIRKGYDGLCSVVPVLREAVEEFEERVRKLEREQGGGGGGGGAGGGRKKKKGKGDTAASGGATGGKTGALMGGINVGGEKIDGRAGPKSEAVVLSKTVDHVRQLLLDRATLLEKLSSLHSQAAENGIEVPAATAHEWDETYYGESDDPEAVKAEGEDEEMWEDE